MQYELKQAIAKKRTEVLRDMRARHGAAIKEACPEAMKSLDAMEAYLDGINYEEWENIAFDNGFVAGLRWVRDHKVGE